MKMTTVQIAYNVPAATVAKIEAHLNETAIQEPDWNGAVFKIERDDFTCMEEDSIRAQILLGEINRIISGNYEKSVPSTAR